MSLLLLCDRCGDATENPQLKAVGVAATLVLPSGWETICGTTLCNSCAREAHQWLSTKVPKDADR